MNHMSATPTRRVDPCSHRLEGNGVALEFAEWLAVNAAGLADLAGWLGGAVWRRRAERLGAAARSGFVDEDEVYELLDLFSLRHVGDSGRPETTLFSLLDLSHPHVHECCLAAESLSKGLLAIADERADASDTAELRKTRRAA